jgi:7-keto-8-aminopelargonate synthetase-like enzyme
MAKSRAEGFLQSWLFFALLAQGLDRFIEFSDFLSVRRDYCLHTSKLNHLLQKWQNKEKEDANAPMTDERRHRYLQASMDLSQARKYVTKHLSTIDA